MAKLESIRELEKLRARVIEERTDSRPRIVVCSGTACQASGASDIVVLLKRFLLERDLIDRIALRITGCFGFCEMGPFILTEPQGAFYSHVKEEDLPRIINAVLEGTYVEDLLYADPVTGEKYYKQDDIPFFAKQKRTILGQNQAIDPIRFNNYIASGGYNGLAKVVETGDKSWVIDEVKKSKLRGRGGAGFPAGTKWGLLAAQDGSRGKYVVCNADEGDPGAYMDRSILEGNPHSVIEGMIIGGLAMGATEGFIFVRHEYPLAIKHTLIALRVARAKGLMGDNILGSGLNFDISIVESAGAFVCGEETALIKTIEGYMGEPRQRPPFPIEKGIWGKPTVINNVETWANIPVVMENGGDVYAEVGTENSTGTKVFSLVGKIKNTGLVEVPMGISIKEIIYEIGGGPPEGGNIKAVQIGGPSGGCIPADNFDLPIDYDSLTKAGAIMGSGGMIVMDDATCMVDVAKYFMKFLMDESCGKCFTCRKGTQRMYEILDDITRGEGTLEQLDLLEELAEVVKDTTMCGLGQSAPNPVLSTLRYFRHEYEQHILDKRCDALVCKELVGAPCQATCPVGTEAWKYVAHIANGDMEKAYLAIRENNPFPSVCARVCDHKCESQCRLGTTGNDPVAIRDLKRFVTDRVDPKTFEPSYEPRNGDTVAVVGSGPAGLTAAHYLSRMGYKVSIYEADGKAGGMLHSCIPTYRLPPDVMDKEVDALIDGRCSLNLNTIFGKDITLNQILEEGHKAVFLGLGAHRSRKLRIEGEDGAGVYPSMRFLKSWNMNGKNLAKGKVGIIGGGNSAVDAARVALRQSGVESVTILYRRTRDEMPAFEPEIQGALKEGVALHTLVSPTRILAESGKLTGVEFIKNKLGKLDASGRRRPVEIEGSEHVIELDTLVVAIGEQMQAFELDGSNGVEVAKWGAIIADEDTLQTGREGVFAGGDAVTGPNTVIDAIAAGKKAAVMMDRYIKGEDLRQPDAVPLPDVYIEPPELEEGEASAPRGHCPMVSAEDRTSSFVEVEQSFNRQDALQEAKRCLRCDLEFVKDEAETLPLSAVKGGQA